MISLLIRLYLVSSLASMLDLCVKISCRVSRNCALQTSTEKSEKKKMRRREFTKTKIKERLISRIISSRILSTITLWNLLSGPGHRAGQLPWNVRTTPLVSPSVSVLPVERSDCSRKENKLCPKLMNFAFGFC